MLGRRALVFLVGVLALSAVSRLSAVDRSWTLLDGNWSNPGDWSPFGVPTVNDVARIGNFMAVENSTVTLDINDSVDGLEIANGMTLDGNGRWLDVDNGTTITGSNQVGSSLFRSTLRVEPSVGLTAFDTEGLTINSGGQLWLADGGGVTAEGIVTVDGDSQIYGEGHLRLVRNGATALRLDGRLLARGDQGVFIEQLGTARIDLDGLTGNGEVNVQSTFVNDVPFLTINGDELLDDFDGDMRIGNGAQVNMNLTNGWRLGTGGDLRFTGFAALAGQQAELNGSEVSLAGIVFNSSQHSRAEINANVTLEPTVQVTLADGSDMEFDGETQIDGGTFNVGAGAELNFYGDTTLEGGLFRTDTIVPADGVVDFYGQTSWRGDVAVEGIARQSGDATVSSTASVTAEAFDMDGGFGWTTWDITHPMTIDADQIDTLDNAFDGTLQVSGILGHLQVNLTDPTASWQMNGTAELSGPFGGSKISGSHVNMNGTVTAAGNLSITADTTFQSGNSLELVSAGTELTMRAETRVESGAIFSGPGTLRNHADGTFVMEDGANVNVAMINNGRLEVGSGVGTASVETLDHASTGTMQFQIEGLIAGTEYSQLVVDTNVAIQGGTLELLPVAPGYEDPSMAGTVDEFLLITSNFLSGEFDAVFYDGAELDWEFTGVDSYRSHEGEGLFRVVEYTDDDVVFTNYKALAGDANGDGTVDGQDFVMWNDNKFMGGTDWTTGDFNGDGITDGQDFVLWNDNKFASVDFNLRSVPEPSLGWVGFLGIVIAFRSRAPRR